MSNWTVDDCIAAARKDPDSYGRQVYELSNKRIALSNQVRALRTALEEAEATLAQMERPAAEDPDYATAVQSIGGGVSYGAIMSTAEALWRQLLSREGLDGAEHVHGPSRHVVERTLAVVRKALGK